MADEKDVVNNKPNVVDAEKIRDEAVAVAEEKATERIDEAKEDFDKKLEGVEERATTKARDSIVEAISGKKEETWKPKTYEEITDKAKRDTLEEVDKRLADRDAKTQEEAKKTQEVRSKRDAEYDKYWDTQLDNIAEVDESFKLSEDTVKFMEGRSLRSLTPSEVKELKEKDEGFNNRAKLEQEAVANQKSDLELYYYKEYKNKPSGATAPVFTGSKAVTPTDKADFDYSEIQGKKPSDIVFENTK